MTLVDAHFYVAERVIPPSLQVAGILLYHII